MRDEHLGTVLRLEKITAGLLSAYQSERSLTYMVLSCCLMVETGGRTPGPSHANATLRQLSYVPRYRLRPEKPALPRSDSPAAPRPMR